ncbi:hypothetical protein KGM_211747 [Danaus plexippus plexippus]|uniref:Uncharacterized protein n=1 Tax=Danaus plexippus plexippus TaxID=278856 RepID=A0A212EPE9_DANPL|nr:hypothetical protein KGM_211747 [Danaus plexippus plexippus]
MECLASPSTSGKTRKRTAHPENIAKRQRQLYLYSWTIEEGSSKAPLTTQNVFAYCWTEDQYAKGANAIAFIVYHRLMNTNLTDISTDTLSFHRTAYVEKDVKKLECILRPEDYLEIIGTYSTIVRMGSDCEVLDFKRGMSSVIKDVGSWHFQFKNCKRFLIQWSKEIGNVVIPGEVHYTNNMGVLKKITRKNKKASDLNPEVIIKNIVRSEPAKLVDVKKLFTTHFILSGKMRRDFI